MIQTKPGPKPKVPLDTVISAFKNNEPIHELSKKIGLSANRIYVIYNNHKKMKQIFDRYVTKFNELAKLSDKEQAHHHADELLKQITIDVLHKRLDHDQVVTLHKMFDELPKFYA